MALRSVSYPIKTIAEVLDLTERRIRQLVTDGVIPANKDRGRYELIPTVRAYVHWLRDRSLYGEAKKNKETVISLDEARRRKVTAEAELAELELEKERGEVVDIAETEKAWTDVLMNVRAKMLAMPTTLAAQIAVETDQKIIKELLTNSVENALMELSSIEIKQPPEDEPSRDESDAANGTASKADGKPMGRPGEAA